MASGNLIRVLVHAAALQDSDLATGRELFAFVNELRGIDGKQARLRACQTLRSEDQEELQDHARTLAVSGGPSFIAMVQATHLRYRHDRTHVGCLHRAWLRRVFPQRQVRSGPMVVIEIRSKDSAQRAFIEHDHMVETFPPNGANHPFHVRSLPRRPGHCSFSY